MAVKHPEPVTEPSRPVRSEPPRRRRPPAGRPPWRLVVGALVAIAVALAVPSIRGLLPSFDLPFGTETVDRSNPPILTEIRDLREYRAASGHFELILDIEKDVQLVPDELLGERTLFIAAGDVDASVDFSRLDEDAVRTSDDRLQATITLPHATLGPARVDTEASRVYDRDEGLGNRLQDLVTGDDANAQRELYLEAERKLAEAAAASDIVTRAEENTRAMLVGLLGSLGYTQVEVRFE